ncbi:MAG: hypothetical protein WKF57_06980 [Nakamurella sp.]
MKTTPLLRTAVTAALLVFAVSGCGGEVSGSSVGPSYSPPDPASATAQSLDLQKAVAVSSSGALIAVIQDGQFCVRDREPTGAKGTAATCAESIELSGRQPAVFSPTGSRIVVFDSAAEYAGRGRAWIVNSASGTTVPITLPASTSSSSAGATAAATSGTDSTGAGRQDSAITYLWQSDDALYAVGLAGAVYRVTPSTGEAVLLAPGGDRSTGSPSAPALGGGTIAMVLRGVSGTGARLVTVSVVDGTVRDPAVTFEEGVTQPILMGVSPDGAKALLSTANLQTAVPGETRIYDLASGEHSVVPGTESTFAAGGAFSPDGSLVALVASGKLVDFTSAPAAADGNRFHLQLAPADASTAPRDLIGADDETRNVYGPLQWSTAGVIATAASPVPTASAWTVSG